MKTGYKIILAIVVCSVALYFLFIYSPSNTIDGKLTSVIYMDDKIIVTLINGTSPIIVKDLVIEQHINYGKSNGSMIYLYNYLKNYENDVVVIEYCKPVVGSVSFIDIW